MDGLLISRLISLAAPALVSSTGTAAKKTHEHWFNNLAESLSEPELKAKGVTKEVRKKLKKAEQEQKSGVLQTAETDLARWYEIAEQDWVTSEKVRDPETLLRHLYLEVLFQEWFKGWGWDVQHGQEISKAGTFMDHRSDVLAKPIMGKEQAMVVNFVCDDLPSTFRVIALFNTLDANWEPIKDVAHTFVVATHATNFSGPALAYMDTRAQEAHYSVIRLAASELKVLKEAVSPKDRWDKLQRYKLGK